MENHLLIIFHSRPALLSWKQTTPSSISYPRDPGRESGTRKGRNLVGLEGSGQGCGSRLRVLWVVDRGHHFDTAALEPSRLAEGAHLCGMPRFHILFLRNHWKVVAEPRKMPGWLASGGEEFSLGPETRLDRSELLCHKVLLKYKRDREGFWQTSEGGRKRDPLLVLAMELYTFN